MAADTRLQVVISARDDASKTFDGLSKSIGQLGNQLKRDITVGALAAGGAIAAAGTFAIKAAANYEQLSISFQTMIGNAAQAGKLMTDISEFARKTPFTLPEVAQGAKQLLAYGFAQDEVIKSFKMLGNIAAGLSIPIGDLVYLFGTLRAQGRAYTRDIMQFAMRGIPIYDLLAQVLGISKDKINEMVEAGKVGFPEVQQALTLLGGEGGKWGDLMDKQAKTLAGTWSNLKDNFTRFALDFIGISTSGEIEENGLFARIKKSAQELLDWLDANQPMIEAHFTSISDKIIYYGKQVQQATIWLNQHREVAYVIAIVLLALAAALGTVGAAFLLIIGTGYAVYRLWKEIFGIVTDVRNLFNAFFIAVRVQAIVWADTMIAQINRVKNAFTGSAPGQALGKIKNFFGFQTGGQMPYTGMAYLHKGERVLPAGTFTGRGGQGMTINIYGGINNNNGLTVDQLKKELGRAIENARLGVY